MKHIIARVALTLACTSPAAPAQGAFMKAEVERRTAGVTRGGIKPD
jgi:hypothetical protein